MNLLTLIFNIGKKTVETVTLADIEAQLDAQERAAAIIAREHGYIPAPPGAVVLDKSTSPVEVTHNAEAVMPDFMVYDKDGYVPASEWAQLNREADAYVANLPSMPRDPATGRPMRMERGD